MRLPLDDPPEFLPDEVAVVHLLLVKGAVPVIRAAALLVGSLLPYDTIRFLLLAFLLPSAAPEPPWQLWP